MADLKDDRAPLIDLPPSYESAASPTNNANAAAVITPTKPRPPPLRAPLPLELPLLNLLRGKRVILASASPRRKQLLGQIGLNNLEISPCPLPENLPKESLSPLEYVLATATRKALHVYSSSIDHATLPDPALVIAADTVVVASAPLSSSSSSNIPITTSPAAPKGAGPTAPGGVGIGIGGMTILEKPRSEVDHVRMLQTLRAAQHHKVYTAVVCACPLSSARDPGYALESHVEETTVRFGRDISDDMILAYVRTREGADKAGGYAVQGTGALLVEGIDGSWDNVVGLPLRATWGLIEKVMRTAQDDEVDDGFVDEFAAAEERDDED